MSPVRLSIRVTTAETSPSVPGAAVTETRTFVRSFRRSSESSPSSRKTVESWSFVSGKRTTSFSAIAWVRFEAS